MSVVSHSQLRGNVARSRTAAAIVDRRLGELDEHVRRRTMPPLWRRGLSALFTALIIAGIVFLWPARLGGSTNIVVVRGTSMVPVYDLNDIVVARGADSYNIGDIVVFSVPEGVGKGMLVIHRLIGKRADGTWMTQGDNRDTPDQFLLHDEDLKGKPMLRVPKAGRLLGVLSNVYVISVAFGLLAIVLLWPKPQHPADADVDAAAVDAAAVDAVAVDALVEPVRPTRITAAVAELIAAEQASYARLVAELDADDVAAEAEAWLAEELHRLGVSL